MFADTKRRRGSRPAGARLVQARPGGAVRGPVQPALAVPQPRPLPAHRQGLQQRHGRR